MVAYLNGCPAICCLDFIGVEISICRQAQDPARFSSTDCSSSRVRRHENWVVLHVSYPTVPLTM